MDPLEKEILLRETERYGYQLMQPSAPSPVETLSKMLTAEDIRILEGVPVVLTNVLMNNESFDLNALEYSLPDGLKKRFRIFAAITLLFLFWVPQAESSRTKLTAYLKDREPTLTDTIEHKLRTAESIAIGDSVVLSGKRLEKIYKDYVVQQFTETQSTLTKRLENERHSALEEALSEFFTPKQKELIVKMLNRLPLSKSEREYYSRSIKPRLRALRNPDLQSLASTLTN